MKIAPPMETLRFSLVERDIEGEIFLLMRIVENSLKIRLIKN